MLNVNINRVLFYWIVRTSNAVSIDIVLGDKPIVVTPPANRGLARDCHAAVVHIAV